MSLKHAVLGVLSARPMTGYDLSRFFDASMSWLWSARHSQVYPLLSRLVEEALVVATEGARGHQRKVTYAITDAGRAELLAWVATAHAPTPERDPFWLQAVFLDEVDPETAGVVLRRYVEGQRATARAASQHADELRAGATSLVRERLTRRPPNERDRILAIKAAVFDAQAQIALTRAEQAEALLAIVHR